MRSMRGRRSFTVPDDASCAGSWTRDDDRRRAREEPVSHTLIEIAKATRSKRSGPVVGEGEGEGGGGDVAPGMNPDRRRRGRLHRLRLGLGATGEEAAARRHGDRGALLLSRCGRASALSARVEPASVVATTLQRRPSLEGRPRASERSVALSEADGVGAGGCRRGRRWSRRLAAA